MYRNVRIPSAAPNIIKTDILAGMMLLIVPFLAGRPSTMTLRFNGDLYVWMVLGIVMLCGRHKRVPLIMNLVWIVIIMQLQVPIRWLLSPNFVRSNLWLLILAAGCILGGLWVAANAAILKKMYFLPGLLVLAGYAYRTCIPLYYMINTGSSISYNSILRTAAPKILAGIAVMIYFSRYKDTAERESVSLRDQKPGTGSGSPFEYDHSSGIKRKKGGQDLWDIR